MKLADVGLLITVWLVGSVGIGAYLGFVGSIAWRVMQWLQ